jgi:hypothetical protein
MKFLHIFFLIALPVLTTLSCGSDNDDDDDGSDGRQSQNEKDLFSRWTRADGFFLDLRNGTFGVPFNFSFFYRDGAVCNCGLVLSGTQTSGEAQISSCTYAGGGAGDPGCFQLNDSATYTKDESELRVCDSGGCGVYR